MSNNRSVVLGKSDISFFRGRLLHISKPYKYINSILDKTILGDSLNVIELLPKNSVDLAIVDPPYNLRKNFNGNIFNKKSSLDYKSWIKTWILPLKRMLKPTASIYVCSEWSSSNIVHDVLLDNFIVRNRITWEREKGRGSKINWKNCSEDIWFCTLSDTYTFNVDSVKLKRKVIAPYTNVYGSPRDWQRESDGNFRLTYPSNLWTDITVPFWSMTENTYHPTQKPEKLIAKLILASSNTGDIIFDPFLGSGTTSVVAKKLGRHYLGIEINEEYACLAEKRLKLVEKNKKIQGYDGITFLDRNIKSS